MLNGLRLKIRAAIGGFFMFSQYMFLSKPDDKNIYG